MGFRLRKSIKIAPGIRLNLSKSGISASFGKRGASVNVGTRGTYVNLGIPGSGMSFREKLGSNKQSHASSKNTHIIQNDEILAKEDPVVMSNGEFAIAIVAMILYIGFILGIFYGLWRLLLWLIF